MSMHRLSRRWLPLAFASTLAVLAFLSSPPGVRAQQRIPSGLPSPRLTVLSPAGARVGTTVELSVGGLHLEDPEKLIFSHPGIKAEVLPPPPPPTDPKTGKPKGGMPAPTPGIVKFKVTLPADTPLGVHDVRLVTKWGVSNPRAFVVGDLNEVAEKEPNNEDTQAQRIEINTTVTGTFASPTDVDYFTFAGKKGQRVVFSCRATSIDSRAQPALDVYDSRGKQLAGSVNYLGNDSLTDCTLPADGDYVIRLYQFTHTFRQPIPLPGAIPAGMSDHFYRLTVTTAPWIDAVFPSVLEPGKATTVTVYGRNLPGGKLDPDSVVDHIALEKATVNVTAPAAPELRQRLLYADHQSAPMSTLNGFELRLRNDAGTSNPALLTFADAPVVLDNGDNDTPDKAQAVPVPCAIAGRVEKRRDRDWYAFTAKKGQTFHIEVISQRTGAPTWMYLQLRNPATKSDIYESPLNDNINLYSRHFFTRSEDPPVYRFTAPADGTYQLLVANRAADASGGYGPRHTYMVRIVNDDTDFHLVAISSEHTLPDAVTVPAGGSGGFTVLAFRPEGFGHDIELTVEGLPPGVTCPPQSLSAAVRQMSLAVSAAPGTAPWTGEVKVKGTATINGAKVTREARGGSTVWPIQPNQNQIAPARTDKGIYLAVRGQHPFVLTTSIDKPVVPQGDKATIKVVQDRPWADFKTPLQVSITQEQQQQGFELPINLRVNNNQPITLNPTQKEGTLAVTIGPDVPPGTYNIVLRGQGQAPFSKDPMAKTKPPTNIVGVSNAVALTVLPKSLATVTLSTPNPTVKIGGQVEVVVRVARKFNYSGEYKIQVDLPPGVAGISADPITIPAGADEAKLVLKVPAGAAPGNRANLTLKAVALFQGKVPTPDEVKFNVNVVK
jgi:hypothetical protein